MNKRDEEYELPTDLSKFVPYTPFTVNKRDEAVLEEFKLWAFNEEDESVALNGKQAESVGKYFLQKLQEERELAFAEGEGRAIRASNRKPCSVCRYVCKNNFYCWCKCHNEYKDEVNHQK